MYPGSHTVVSTSECQTFWSVSARCLQAMVRSAVGVAVSTCRFAPQSYVGRDAEKWLPSQVLGRQF